jgi:hypothetical protein
METVIWMSAGLQVVEISRRWEGKGGWMLKEEGNFEGGF